MRMMFSQCNTCSMVIYLSTIQYQSVATSKQIPGSYYKISALNVCEPY